MTRARFQEEDFPPSKLRKDGRRPRRTPKDQEDMDAVRTSPIQVTRFAAGDEDLPEVLRLYPMEEKALPEVSRLYPKEEKVLPEGPTRTTTLTPPRGHQMHRPGAGTMFRAGSHHR